MKDEPFEKRATGWCATAYGGSGSVALVTWVAGNDAWPGPFALGIAVGLLLGGLGFGILWLLLHWHRESPESRIAAHASLPVGPPDTEIISMAGAHCASLRRAIEIIQEHRAATEAMNLADRVRVSALTRSTDSDYNVVKIDVLACVKPLGLDLHHKFNQAVTKNILAKPFEWPPVFPWRGPAANALEAALAEWQRIEAEPARYRRLYHAAS